MATLEQVEKLREKANVSYDEAKAALDAVNGDLLDAMIYLERQGKVNAPQNGGFYSNKNESSAQASEQAAAANAKCTKGESFGDLMKRFGRFLVKLFHKGNTNSFSVYKGDECKASVPVTVLVVLLFFAFWIILPLIIIGLFFGLQYRFVGPELGRESVNSAMESASKVAGDIKNSIKGEINK